MGLASSNPAIAAPPLPVLRPQTFLCSPSVPVPAGTPNIHCFPRWGVHNTSSFTLSGVLDWGDPRAHPCISHIGITALPDTDQLSRCWCFLLISPSANPGGPPGPGPLLLPCLHSFLAGRRLPGSFPLPAPCFSPRHITHTCTVCKCRGARAPPSWRPAKKAFHISLQASQVTLPSSQQLLLLFRRGAPLATPTLPHVVDGTGRQPKGCTLPATAGQETSAHPPALPLLNPALARGSKSPLVARSMPLGLPERGPIQR